MAGGSKSGMSNDRPTRTPERTNSASHALPAFELGTEVCPQGHLPTVLAHSARHHTDIVARRQPRAPADDLWLLVLTYLKPGEQRLLQATYEDLRNAFETRQLSSRATGMGSSCVTAHVPPAMLLPRSSSRHRAGASRRASGRRLGLVQPPNDGSAASKLPRTLTRLVSRCDLRCLPPSPVCA
jgi:hypothetical protein